MNKAANKLLVFAFLPFLFYSCLESGEGNNEDLLSGVAAARWDVGKSANLLLSADHFTALELEMVYMKGYKPSQEMLERMVSFLELYTVKPGGISVISKEIPAMDKGEYSAEDIAKIENDYRKSYNKGKTIAVFLLVLDGNYKQTDEESFTIGAAYRNTSLVLFGKPIEDNSGGIRKVDKATLETTVALHEMGHLLGLVNSGTDMVNPHEDEENKNHCENEDCLMYWAIETNRIFGFMQRSVPTLDGNCKMDIRANGGR
jgi:predicted Zn-dependent protease